MFSSHSFTMPFTHVYFYHRLSSFCFTFSFVTYTYLLLFKFIFIVNPITNVPHPPPLCAPPLSPHHTPGRHCELFVGTDNVSLHVIPVTNTASCIRNLSANGSQGEPLGKSVWLWNSAHNYFEEAEANLLSWPLMLV